MKKKEIISKFFNSKVLTKNQNTFILENNQAYLVLSEKERNDVAKDIAINLHDENFYSFDWLVYLMDINFEKLDGYFLAEKIMGNNFVADYDGAKFVEGKHLTELISNTVGKDEFFNRIGEKYIKHNDLAKILIKNKHEEQSCREYRADEYFIYKIN